MAAAVCAMMLCGGCRGAYLVRLAYEEVRYLGGATAATEILATTQDPERRRALEALLSVREFAAGQGLDVGGSYRKVAAMASASPFHVVTAAWQDRLEPFTWWYPIVGDIPYRGYFNRESAERFAARLDAKGLDTMIVEASAYSTLGWFDDPLPSSVLERGEDDVVITVLHEVVHQTFFAPGEVEFNETLATAVAWQLAERYYAGRGDDGMALETRRQRQAWILRGDVLDAMAVRLREFFARARADRLSHSGMLAGRARLYAEIHGEVARADPVFAAELAREGLDNASFLAGHRYANGARAIDAFLAAQTSVAAAFARLESAVARGEDLRAVVGLPVRPD